MLERRLNEMDLMLNMNALNNAVAVLQMVAEGGKKPMNMREAVELTIKIAKQLRAWTKQHDITIMVYVDKKKDGRKPGDYDEFFTAHGFERNERGGYYARMRQCEFGTLVSENNWIMHAFIIKTEVATVQEGK
ncbi:MAG: hypothetical protein DRN07_05080 [Thermoplasmata archaeon]|nr:MAG: hypothetical protein DRN07_05080 [Thermoplasmata archaeon]